MLDTVINNTFRHYYSFLLIEKFNYEPKYKVTTAFTQMAVMAADSTVESQQVLESG